MYTKVLISTKAGAKIDRLILNQNKEVGFFGTVEYKDQTVIVTDILIYKQTVTSVTVNTDPMDIIQFMTQHRDIKSKIRFQGHSHVNMATNPSGVDTTFYKSLVADLPTDEVYVFMIFNKRNENYSIIYQEGKYYKTPVEWEIDTELDYSQIEEYIEPLPHITLQKPSKNKWFKKSNPKKQKPGYGGPINSYHADDDYIDELLKKYYGYGTPNRDNNLPKWFNHY